MIADREVTIRTFHTRSMIVAVPCPTLTHIAHNAYRPPACASWSGVRARAMRNRPDLRQSPVMP